MYKVVIAAIVALALVALTGCADLVPYTIDDASAHVYGFWGGLWHGLILFWNLIMMIPFDDVTVYAPSNNGGWYAFGFWLGATSFTGGAAKSVS